MSIFERAIQHYVMDYKPAVTLANAGADSASSLADTRGVR